MPGAALDEVVDDTHFLGTVKIKVGAITASYKGKVEYAEVDAAGHSIRLAAEGRETGGGTAKGTIAMALSGTWNASTASSEAVDINPQVLTMMTSANAGSSVLWCPAAPSLPSIISLSTWFREHPRVSRKTIIWPWP